ncbi:hypothetical protein CMI37_27690 [Candidatus Pacearchaeota archaeon]|nr:hypothetical protein [Candidatus Pacearchaeota archaeon]|tara:strand:- start:579 stop:995 length:417 start_codon:yes stop_codon:yes gene_type:complete
MDNDDEFGIKEVPEVWSHVSHKDKYWGHITSVYADDNFTLKKIFMEKGSQSSLEYHVRKDEYYYILSGRLKVGFRIGRAKNTSVIMEEGETIHIKPGLMHMRMALKDTIIIEWSNKDDDSDSNIVEDGKHYIHMEDKR